MTYRHLLYEKRGNAALIILNRPEVLNALNAALHEDLFRCIAEARNDDAVRVIVITGAGRGFCSGADLTGRTPSDPSGASLHPDPGQNERLGELQWFGRQAVAMFSVDKPTSPPSTVSRLAPG